MIGENLIKYELDNGLTIFVLPKKGFSKKYAIYATEYGSIDSAFKVSDQPDILYVPDGIAHFLEHKLFEEKHGNVFDKFAELGASANAYTNFTTTAYLFSATENFSESLKTLIDFVNSPYFTDENVEKEKGIIQQELRMYQDDPNWKIFFNLVKCLYKNHPVRIDIGGTEKSILKINKELLYKCYNTFYHPENMSIFITGDVDSKEVYNQIKETFQKFESKPQGEIERYYPKEPDEVSQVIIKDKASISEPLCSIGFKDNFNGFNGIKLLKKEISSRILLDMLVGRSSDLYESLYQESLIDENFSIDYECEKDYSFALLGGPTKNPDLLYEKMFNGIKTIRKKGFKESDFERTKKKIIGNYIKGFNSLEFISSVFISYRFKNINIMDYLNTLEEIKYEDIKNRFVDFLDEKNHSCSIVEPE